MGGQDRIQGNLFSSKLGRRLFAVFCFCSLVPLVITAAVAFSQVRAQLEQQGLSNLQESTKAMGMTIYERMVLLKSELDRVGSVMQASRQERPELGDGVEKRFVSITCVEEDGPDRKLLQGDASVPQRIRNAALDVRPGKTALLVEKDLPRSLIYMVRRTGGGGSGNSALVGRINTSFLWKIGSINILPHRTDLCVVDQRGNVIISSLEDPSAFMSQIPADIDKSGNRQFEWSGKQGECLARCWKVFMESRFSGGNWMVFLSRSKENLFASVDAFQRIFPMILLMAFFIVVLLSMINIRLILDPLEKLKLGIQRISGQNFASPIRVKSHDEFEVVADALNDMASQLGRQFRAMETINEVDRAILSSLEPEVIINKMLSGMQKLLSCSHVAVILADPYNRRLATCYKQAMGGSGAGERRPVDFDPLAVGESLRGRSYLHVKKGENVAACPVSFSGDAAQCLVLPVFVRDRVAATVNLDYPEDAADFSRDLQYATQLADQMGVALANSKLVRELDDLSEGALTALARTVDAKSPWTAGHSERVSAMAWNIGRFMGLEKPRLNILHRAALLHDIGKIGISSAILDKPGPLTDEEYAVIKEHPRMGVRILDPIKVYKDIVPVVLQHHERYDGKGYPDGVSGEDIVLEARIMTIADVFDALISDRPYRSGWKQEEVFDFILQNSGMHFDPQVVEAFASMVGEGPIRGTAASVQTKSNTATI
ncbi:MAG: HD domain-containing phosphohydrolase [Desulfosalsimonadaceae bacterium]